MTEENSLVNRKEEIKIIFKKNSSWSDWLEKNDK